MATKVKKAQDQPSMPHSVGVTGINLVETTFKWVVSNFSFYQKGYKNKLSSPVFETTNNKNITWSINLDPNASKNFTNLSLNLTLVQSELPEICATFEFSIINKDGGTEKTTMPRNAIFYKGASKSSKILMSNAYFTKNEQKILPNDTLTLLCKIKANLDQGVTNTLKVKATPKRKPKVQGLNEAGALPTEKKVKIGCKQKSKMQAQLNNLNEATSQVKIGALPQPNTNTQTNLNQVGATAAKPLIKNVVNQANNTTYPPTNSTYAYSYASSSSAYAYAYPPANAAYAYSYSSSNTAYAYAYPSVNVVPPPTAKPAASSSVNTTSQSNQNFASPGSTAAQSANSSTSSTFGVGPPFYKNIFCNGCKFVSQNCICNNCKYCKVHIRYCKCIYCNYCNLRLQDCKCIYCDYCNFHRDDCDCYFCPYCDMHDEECECDFCEYCCENMIDCECTFCPDCDRHDEECFCDICNYCFKDFEDCECEFCADCYAHIEECDCNGYYY